MILKVVTAKVTRCISSSSPLGSGTAVLGGHPLLNKRQEDIVSNANLQRRIKGRILHTRFGGRGWGGLKQYTLLNSIAMVTHLAHII